MNNRSEAFVGYKAILLLAGLFLMGSCQTYKYGYWHKLPATTNNFLCDNDSAETLIRELALKKDLLNKETFELSGKITAHLQTSGPIPMVAFNSLYENLHDQYKTDTLYHLLWRYSPDEQIRLSSKQALLEAAVTYKKAFQRNKFLRRTINRGDMAYGIPANTLAHTQQFLWSDKENRRYLVGHEKDKKATHTLAGYTLSNLTDTWHLVGYRTVYFFSKIFGQFAGQFHGKIDKKINAQLLRSNLQEFDIVMLKSLTHLTEKFIPGYFGHVGVCLGNDLMIETPRTGVRICSTEDFSDGEVYLIIRPTKLSEEQKQKIRRSLRNQVGKKYDFNFDSQSPDRIVCSDLICLSFDFVNWESKKRAGHYVTSPDDLVKSLLGRPDFSFEMYINKGQFVSKPDLPFIQELLKKK